jgi:uncharacterized protein YacL
MKRSIYELTDALFSKQGLVYALLTAQLGLLLEYYLLVFSPQTVFVLAALHLTFVGTVAAYVKRESLENGFVGTLETQAEKRTNEDVTEFGDDE